MKNLLIKKHTIIDMLNENASSQPDKRIYTFLSNTDAIAHSLTNKELLMQTRALAGCIRKMLPPEERIILLLPPGIMYITSFFACMYAGVIAVPAYPPKRNNAVLAAIINDSGAHTVLSSTEISANIHRQAENAFAVRSLDWINADAILNDETGSLVEPAITGDSIAFMQYTSGSTALPRGVVLSHNNLIHNLSLVYDCFGHSADSRGVIWLPPYHDMGLIGGILQPVFGNFEVVLMPPAHFLQNPVAWLKAISDYKATTSGGPNFAYELCVNRITEKQCEELDLRHWEVAFTGAEPVRAETLFKFYQKFKSCGFRLSSFYPCYGLAEATLLVTGGEKGRPPHIIKVEQERIIENKVSIAPETNNGNKPASYVSCGKPAQDQKIGIIDPQTLKQCLPGQIGEIWLAGPSIARGYWRQQEKTQEIFHASRADTGEGPFLRTGDLGFMEDGELYITGRLKDLIIIRGRNYYPQDLELIMEKSYPGFYPGGQAAFTIEIDGEERLCILQEVEPRERKKFNITEAADAIRQNIFKYFDLQVYGILFLKVGTIPRTSSGKIRRHACREVFFNEKTKVLGKSIPGCIANKAKEALPADTLPDHGQNDKLIYGTLLSCGELSARLTILKKYLQEKIAKILHLSAGGVDPEKALGALGLDSLTAFELKHIIQAELHVDLPIEDLLDSPTISQLAGQICNTITVNAAGMQKIRPMAKPGIEDHPLSYGQKAFFFMQELAPDNTAYHIANALYIKSPVDVSRFKQVLHDLVIRHPLLRGSFPVQSGEPVLHISGTPGFFFEAEDIPHYHDKDLQTRINKAVQCPFNLQTGPLLRVYLLSRDAQEHILLVVIHHIIADFWSLAILLNELALLYTTQAGHPLEPSPVQYTDYIYWHKQLLAAGQGEEHWHYWKEELKGKLPRLNLPFAKQRPTVQTFNGASYKFCPDKELYIKLQHCAQQQNATLYMLLLAAFQVLLNRYTRQEDILIGSPAANRNREEWAGIFGLFVNTIVLRAKMREQERFASFLNQVRCKVLAALKHQEYPFNLLVEKLQPERDPSRSPVFQAMFILQQTPPVFKKESILRNKIGALAIGKEGISFDLYGLTFASMQLKHEPAQFDITLSAGESDDNLQFSFQYNKDLFPADSIQLMAEHFINLMYSIVSDPLLPIAELNYLTPKECTFIKKLNTTAMHLPEQCLHQLFEKQAARLPDKTALEVMDAKVSYKELNLQANALAAYLVRQQVHAEQPVGIYLQRSGDLLIALLAVLKAGCSYVPIDPAYPEERTLYIMEDSGIKLVLTQQALEDRLRQFNGTILCLDTAWNSGLEEHTANLDLPIDPSRLAYTIYTSGSTGKPKGVQIPHRALLNFLLSMQHTPGFRERDILVSVTTISFDIAGLELYLPLITGGTVVLAGAECTSDGTALTGLLKKSKATVMQATPVTWKLLLESGWTGEPSFKVLCGGEAFPPQLAGRLLEHNLEVWNMYGPTETTVWSAAGRVDNAGSPVPLTAPVANTEIYILDEQLHPLPDGVPGNLYIGGQGLARGYRHDPGKTAAVFIPHPFSSIPGARLYDTGDRARFNHGKIEILGRTDNQVKIHGFRIELSEIETVLQQYRGIKEAVAAVHEGETGVRQLAAYYVADEETVIDKAALRHYLKTKLPDYMLPAVFIKMDAWPLTPNKKIDKKALPAPEKKRALPETSFTTPRNELERKIAEIWQSVLQIDKAGIHDNFFDLGGHSILLTKVRAMLQETLKLELPMVVLFQYPTIRALAAYLKTGQDNQTVVTAPLRQAAAAVTGARHEPIAIIGIACRFPQADNAEQFWRSLVQGVEASRDFSDADLLKAGVSAAVLTDKNYVKTGPVLDNIECFDADFFGFNPREALLTDPQQRLLLEAAWEALEQAGYIAAHHSKRIGVFTSSGFNHYLLHNIQPNIESLGIADDYQIYIGNDKDFAPTRISYKLNLKGPSINVQTACSSSLVAVHMACRSILNDEADIALAGGISINTLQKRGYLYQAGGILSGDGHCRAFAADAGGTVRGSGLGLVVLKRLSAAARDGDHIYAVIRGSGINNDGADKIGYTAPGVDGQADVIRKALEDAHVHPEQIGYIEAHGTGTSLGDPVEIAALSQAFLSRTKRNQYCAIGSVKSNIGHLDTAAGIAGLIKTALILKHKQIPASLHINALNPQIDFIHSPFCVNTRLTDWKTDGEARIAGVSSFGIGGTNVHMILEEAPQPAAVNRFNAGQLLCLSARSESALKTLSRKLGDYAGANGQVSLTDAAYTLKMGRRDFNHRQILVCNTMEQVPGILSAQQKVLSGVAGADAQYPVFMFSGQGAHYQKWAGELYQTEGIFKKYIDQCSDLLAGETGWQLEDSLFEDQALTGQEQRTDAAKQLVLLRPAVFAIEYALARLLIERGLSPRAMIGYGAGEYTAAVIAGVFTLEACLKLIAGQSILMQKKPPLAMLAVNLSEQEITKRLDNSLRITAVTSPALCIVAGNSARVEQLRQELEAEDVIFQLLPALQACFLPFADEVEPSYIALLKRLELHAPRIPFISNVNGDWITAGQAMDPGYWAGQPCRTMRFKEGLEKLFLHPEFALVEVGTGRHLNSLIKQHTARNTKQTVCAVSPSLLDRQTGQEALLLTFGKLWLAGVSMDWSAFYKESGGKFIPLPTYPFESKPYWLDEKRAPGKAKQEKGVENPLKKAPLQDWFYARLWKQAVMPPHAILDKPGERKQHWLILGSDGAVKSALIDRLEKLGQSVAAVGLSAAYKMLDHDTYQLNPANQADYFALFAQLNASARLPQVIIHLLNLSDARDAMMQSGAEAPDLNAGFYSLLYLAQAVEKVQVKETVRLKIVSDNLYNIYGEQTHAVPKAVLLGPCRVIPQEYPQVQCQSIDFSEAGVEEPGQLAGQLLAEVLYGAADTLVAYRHNTRWVNYFAPVQVGPRAPVPRLLKHRGVYLVTGGTGGIGLIVARYLAEAVQARLILTTRHGFPAKAGWNEWLSTHDVHDAVSIKIKAALDLERAGAEVLITGADVTDHKQMEALFAVISREYKVLDGVFHLAGVPGSGMMQFKSAGMADAVLAPKVKGTLVLAALLKDFRPDFMLLFSSITSIIGGLGQADYCAANAFLDAFALARPLGKDCYVASVCWERWKDTGMAKSGFYRSAQDNIPVPAKSHTGNHPLLGSCVKEAGDRIIYSQVFSPEHLWVLSEHAIVRHPTVPGTTYLEMIRKAAGNIAAQKMVVIEHITFLNPLVIDEGKQTEVITVLDKAENCINFQISSKAGQALAGNGKTEPHARGRLVFADAEPARHFDLAELKSCMEEINADFIQEEIKKKSEFLLVGKRWQTLKKIYQGKNQSLLFLELAAEFKADIDQYKLHPALLDVAAGSIQHLTRENFLPFTYENMKIKKDLPAGIYSLIRYNDSELMQKEILKCQVIITDEEGNELISIENFAMKRIPDLVNAAGHIPPAAGTAGREQQQNITDRFNTLVAGDDAFSIMPEEGIAVLKYVLSGLTVPQLIISPVDLEQRIRQGETLTKKNVLKELDALDYPAVMHERPEMKNPYTAPGNPLEEQVARIWQKVLGIAKVGIQDNFFELGGSSLTSIQLISELKKELHVELSEVSIFEAPTIKALVELLTPTDPAQKTAAAFTQVQNRAEQQQAYLEKQAQLLKRRKSG